MKELYIAPDLEEVSFLSLEKLADLPGASEIVVTEYPDDELPFG